MSAATLALAGIAGGFALGSVAHRAGGLLLRAEPALSWFAQLWLNALVMLALPLILSLLFVVVAGQRQSREAGRLGGLTLFLFVAFLVTAGLMSVTVVGSLVRWFPAADATRAAMRASLAQSAAPTNLTTGDFLATWVTNLVPSNVFHALAGGEVLPAILATLLFALAARTISDDRRALLQRFAEAVSEACLAVARLVLRLLPLAVFAMGFAATARAGGSVARGVMYYVTVSSLMMLAATLLLYPITAWLGRISMRRFFVATWPCQVVAATTRSSLASLPSLLDRGRRSVGLPAPVSSFVLPLAVSVFKLDRTISSPLKVIVLAHLYGVPIGSGTPLLFVLLATMLSFGTPGLPSAGAVTTLPLYVAAGLPLEGILLINAVNAIPDIVETALNVTADMSVATIATRLVGMQLAPEPSVAAGATAAPEPAA